MCATVYYRERGLLVTINCCPPDCADWRMAVCGTDAVVFWVTDAGLLV